MTSDDAAAVRAWIHELRAAPRTASETEARLVAALENAVSALEAMLNARSLETASSLHRGDLSSEDFIRGLRDADQLGRDTLAGIRKDLEGRS